MIASTSALPAASAAAETGQDDLWSSILSQTSARKGKSATTKNLIILGERSTGKTTLLKELGVNRSKQQSAAAAGKKPQAASAAANDRKADLDLALSFDYLDIKDDTDEEAIARVGLYQMPSASPPYSTLLPLALSPVSSKWLESLVVIMLDWQDPSNLIPNLLTWFKLLQRTQKDLLSASSASSKGEERPEYIMEAGREAIEQQWRSYVEPGTGSHLSSSTSAAAAAANIDEVAPLSPGTLGCNLGIPIVVVLSKADLIDQLEKDKHLKEDQIDYIQQVLRTICLHYGAGLFYTTRNHPETAQKLKAYLLHRLYSQHTTISSNNLNSSSSEAVPQQRTSHSTAASRAFPFSHKANIVDRDAIVIPSGWDSRGKIAVLRDGFDSKAVQEAWVADVEAGSQSADEQDSLIPYWYRMIPRLKQGDRPSAIARSRVKVQDEQDFLRMHYEILQKESAAAQQRDPRSHFQQSSRSHITSPSLDSTSPFAMSPSLVGPMNSASLHLPSVEKVLARHDEEPRPAPTRKDSASAASSRQPLSPTFSASGQPQSLLSPTELARTRSSQTSPGTPTSQTQNEVLANFFQSLLSARKDPSASRLTSDSRTGTPMQKVEESPGTS